MTFGGLNFLPHFRSVLGTVIAGVCTASLALVITSPTDLIGFASAAENVRLQNIQLDTGGATYRMKTIELISSNLAQAKVVALFDKNAAEPLLKRFGTLSATTITIPELIIERPATGGVHATTMRDVVFRDVVAGKAATMTVTDGSIKAPNDTATFGAMRAKDFDIAMLAGLYTEDRDKALRPILSSFSWDGLQYKTEKGGTFAIDRIASTGVRMHVGGLNKPQSNPNDKSPKFAFPAAGNVTFSGLRIEFPDSSSAKTVHKWAIREVILAADQLQSGLPSALRIAITDWSGSLSSDSGQGLRNLGYETVNASALLEGAWNERTGDFSLKAIRLDFAQIGSVTLTGTLGNVGKDMFSGSGEAIAAAYERVTAKVLTVSFENKGLYERAVAMISKRDHRTADEVRKQFETTVEKQAATTLGNSRNAATIVKGISNFMTKPGVLEITAKSKNPNGVLLSDFKSVGASPPPSVDKLDITATVK